MFSNKHPDVFAHSPRHPISQSPLILEHPAVRRLFLNWKDEGRKGHAKRKRLEELAGKYGQFNIPPDERKGKGRPRKSPDAFDLIVYEFDSLVQILKIVWNEGRKKNSPTKFWANTPLPIGAIFDDFNSSRTLRECAHKVLSRRYGVSPRRIKDVLVEHRGQLRSAEKSGRFGPLEGELVEELDDRLSQIRNRRPSAMDNSKRAKDEIPTQPEEMPVGLTAYQMKEWLKNNGKGPRI